MITKHYVIDTLAKYPVCACQIAMGPAKRTVTTHLKMFVGNLVESTTHRGDTLETTLLHITSRFWRIIKSFLTIPKMVGEDTKEGGHLTMTGLLSSTTG